MKSFLKHSFACGILARIIGAHKNIVQTEQLFVSGLLHDIGRLIVYKYIPDQAGHLIRMVCEKQTSLHRIEKEVAGLSHPDLGRDLLHKWKFPVGLITNVEFHHTPSKAQPPLNASIIHISDIIVTGLGIGSSGETYVPEFDVAAINKLDLPPSIFEPVIQQTLHQVKALESVYGE